MTASRVLAAASVGFAVSAVTSWALSRSSASLWPRDMPNQRSLHSVPTPRTGGLAVLAGLAAALLAARAFPGRAGLWISGATVLLAAVSFADDRRSLPVGLRLAAHALAAGAVVWGAGLAAPRVWLPVVGGLDLGSFAAPLSFLGILWLTNLYNFMDGMDGLAGAMTAIGGSCLGIALWRGGDEGGALVSFLLAAASAGFLIGNWPPARIFLGDVGAIPTGFLVSVLVLRASATGALDPGASCLVFAPFVVDATATLARRALSGEPVWKPHRSHWYQRLVLAGLPQSRVLALEIGCMVLCGALALVWQRGADGARSGIALLVGVLFLGVSRAVARAEARARR